MGGSLFLGGVETSALEHDVDAQLAPRALSSVLDRVDLNFLIFDNDGILCGLDGLTVSALSGIVLQKMSEHFRAGKIVDGDDFIAFSTKHLAESKTANTTETVNGNFNRHGYSSCIDDTVII